MKRNNLTIAGAMQRPSAIRKQQEKAESKKRKRGNFLVRNAKWFLLAFANIVIFIFDALAVKTVYDLTGEVIFATMALLPAGIPIVIWEIGWLYPLAKVEQKDIALRKGIVAGAASALIIAILAIIASSFPQTATIVLTIILIWSTLAILFHAYYGAKFFYIDPVTERDHELSVFTNEQEFQKQSIAALSDVMTELEAALTKEQELREKFGDEAVNTGLAMIFKLEEITGEDINRDGVIGRPQSPSPNGHRPQPQAQDFTHPSHPSQG